MEKILRNSMLTPDGTHLISRTRHDYVTYEDKNGEHYMVDGGNDYLRRSVNKHPAKDTSLYVNDKHELLRKEITWGAVADGKRIYVPIKQMSQAHIANIIADGYTGRYVDLMKAEIEWRDEMESPEERELLELQREASYG